MTFFDYLKSFFLVLIIVNIAPSLFKGIKKQYGHYLEPHSEVGLVTIKGLISNAGPHIKHLQTFFKDSDIKAILNQRWPILISTGSGTGNNKVLKACYDALINP